MLIQQIRDSTGYIDSQRNLFPTRNQHRAENLNKTFSKVFKSESIMIRNDSKTRAEERQQMRNIQKNNIMKEHNLFY